MKTFKPAGQAKAEPVAKPGVIVGDEVYCHHQAGPHAGKVVAHGKHGVTLEGGRKVRWEHVLGHKRRAAQEYTIVDEGEDGCIVQDKNGLRQFIGVPPEAREDQLMIKSNGGQRLALLLKAGGTPYTGRAGLTKKQITDKNGTVTTRWVSSTPEMGHPQVGHHVGWVNGEHKSHGQVNAVGRDGVTARDRAEGIHQVRHEHITHRWDSPETPPASPHNNADADLAGGLFKPGDVEHLPLKVNQPAKSWDELVTKGTEGLDQFRGLLGKVASSMGLESGKKPEALTPEDWGNDKGYLFVAPLKGEKRAKEKCEADYGGDWSQLRDIVRATISVPTMGHIKEALEHLKANGLELAQQPKDRFAKPTAEGYRDLMTFVKLPNGMLAELQIHAKPMTLAKEEGHHHYNITRSLQGKYNEAEPSEKWSDEDHKSFYDAMTAQKDIYGKAWQKIAGGAQQQDRGNQAGERPLTKSDHPRMMALFVRKPL